MQGDGGYVRDYRSTVNWEWFTDVNTAHLWEYIRLRVNYEPSRFRGIEIRRGEMLESMATIAARTGMSVQSVRTAISHLKSTGEITCKSTRYGMLICAVKYAFFQGGADEPNTQTARKKTLPLTQKQQGSNKEVTTYKEDKEEKEEKENKEVVVGKPTPPTPDQVRDYAKSIGYEIDAEYFCDYYGERGWIKKDGTPISDWQVTIRNWKRNERKADAEPERDSEQSQFNFKTTADWLDDE